MAGTRDRPAACLGDTPRSRTADAARDQRQSRGNEREPALRRSLARAALGEPHTIDVTVQDTAHIKVHCDDTDYGQWLAWLHDTREQLGASIDSISVTARPANGITGRVHADVVFGFSGAGAS